MATSNFSLLVLAFSLLAVSAAARPCKTLFFTITSTTSYYHQFPTTISQNPNPNPNIFLHNNPNSIIYPRFRSFFFTTTILRSDPILTHRPDPEEGEGMESRSASSMIRKFGLSSNRHSISFRRSGPTRFDPTRPDMIPIVEFYSSVKSPIRDRTKDIMRVVGAMLFGVGCGALTAATMYLIWSLFWPNLFDFEDFDDDFDDGDDDYDVSAKKMGYVAIPTKVVDDDLKKPAAPAKEVV
ncbi:hypothetical protein K7X08_032925 [Anisodus acutangulus]|uniref:Transmembrane protein n=1 Tax=Anisodus acutangulus TaxID=402998 RepID=A0A9Q1M3Z8_9SOLA|nr:hypothetical protein K7X08_032925 [Anisodus acutangulus]